jgi:photosystem II stability/assembly factor-like uncharacterized protein
MANKLVLIFFAGVSILALASCAATGTPGSITSVPTSTPTSPATSTPTTVPPTDTPTPAPPTPSPTTQAENVIQHYAIGQAITVTQIHMVDASKGWAIGSLGAQVGDHVLITSDGGNTWTDVTPAQPVAASQNLAALGFFADANNGWVTYFTAGGESVPTQVIVWRTTDGGATWIASQPLDLSGLSEFFAPTAMQIIGQEGWLLVHVGAGMNHDYIAIYRTSDGGMNWSRIIDPYIDGGIQGCTKTAMQFTDATHGWLTVDCNGVKAGAQLYQTTDAGSTWQEVDLPEPASYPGIFSENAMVACGTYDPFFFSNDLGHISVNCHDYQGTQITSTYFIFTTQDGGSTWTSAQYPGEALYFITADTGWALAAKIQVTTDGGKTWKAISDVTWTAQFDFISEQLGWAIATTDHEMALVKTDSGGAHWSILTPTVEASSSSMSIPIAHLPSGQEFTVTQLHMVDATNGWAIGGLQEKMGDHVLFTTDGGKTWKDVTPPEPQPAPNQQADTIGYFQGNQDAWVTFFNDGGIPMPSQPVVWHTTDGGASWTASQPLDVSGLNEFFIPSNLQFYGQQAGWLLVHVGVGMSHDYVALYRTNDGGTTWTRIIDPYNDGGIQSCSKNGMIFTSATVGWLTGDCNGVKAGVLLFKTIDAGSTWQEVSLPEPANAPGIYANESSYACGSYDPFFFGGDLGILSVKCTNYGASSISSTYYIYRTQDGGSTWTSNAYPGDALYFFTGSTGWALAPKIQLTTDGGVTWKPISNVSWTAQMDFISESVGWAIATSGNQVALVKTENGGANWSILTPTVR